MMDQAATLRRLVAERRPPTADRRTRVVAVTSGKGGVGKTSLATNLGIVLAQRGARVILLDGDLGLANVHVLLGLTPSRTLQDVLAGAAALSEVIVPGPGGVMVLPGASGLEHLAELPVSQRQALLAALAGLDGQADFLLVDTAAGIGETVSALVLAADEVLLVTTPEPPALTDAYALMKVVARRMAAPRFRLVVNQARTADEASSIGRGLATIARRFLGAEVELVGWLPVDPVVGEAARRQVPFVLAYPGAPATARVRLLGEQFGGWAAPVATVGVRPFLRRLLAGRTVSVGVGR
jgi:flagellar biosynthesis protein FlhG